MAEIQSSINVQKLLEPEVVRIITEDATIHLVSREDGPGSVFFIDCDGPRESSVLGTFVDDGKEEPFRWLSVVSGGRLLVRHSRQGDEILRGRIQRIEMIVDRSLADELRSRALQTIH